jgi:hypothetical protein
MNNSDGSFLAVLLNQFSILLGYGIECSLVIRHFKFVVAVFEYHRHTLFAAVDVKRQP